MAPPKRKRPAKLPFKKRPRKYSRRIQRPLGLHPGTYKFKRSMVHEVNLLASDTGLPGAIATVDGRSIVWHYSVALDNLPGYTEFESLFEQYKLTGVAIKIYPRWSEATAVTGGASNMLMRTKYQRDGRSLDSTATEEKWLEQQATKTNIMPGIGKTLKKYMKLNQLNKVYSGVASGTEDYTIVPPRFISTTEHSTPHCGMQFMFNTTGGALNAQPTYSGMFKLEMCVYFQCRSVH